MKLIAEGVRHRHNTSTKLCITQRTTVTSARIPEEDASYRACNLCVVSCVQKGTPGWTHKGCVLQRVSLGALSHFCWDETKYRPGWGPGIMQTSEELYY